MKNRSGQSEILMWIIIGVVVLILTGVIVLIIYSSARHSAEDNVVLYIIDNSTLPAPTPAPAPNTSYIEIPNVTINNTISSPIPIIFVAQNISNTSNNSNDTIFVDVMINLSNQILLSQNLTPLNATLFPSNCTWHLPYPDPDCSPGEASNATIEMICTPGYSASVRNVSQATKDKVYRLYGVSNHTVGQWEMDHIIPLELGGTNNIINLYPEPATPYPGFHQKDFVENYLHKLVCDGRMPLNIAQLEIVHNWVAYIGLSTTISPNTNNVTVPVGDEVLG
jgi:flagellar basal body-associated protein FliL